MISLNKKLLGMISTITKHTECLVQLCSFWDSTIFVLSWPSLIWNGQVLLWITWNRIRCNDFQKSIRCLNIFGHAIVNLMHQAQFIAIQNLCNWCFFVPLDLFTWSINSAFARICFGLFYIMSSYPISQGNDWIVLLLKINYGIIN